MADEGFLQRWSRRKAEARAPQPEPAPEEAPQRDPPALLESSESAVDAPARDDPDAAVDLATLPDIESLTYESDFTVFLRKGVPPELRKRALQRLWRSSPTLANLDGLVEYGGDYTQIGTAKQVVRTAYQVGRGMLQRLDALPAGEEGARPAAGVARAEPPQPPVTLAPAEPAAAAAPEGSGPGSTDAAIAGPAESSDAGAPAPEAKPAQAASRPRPLPPRG